MRSKAPLALMEQMVMVLVFALAAALCLQAFALGGPDLPAECGAGPGIGSRTKRGGTDQTGPGRLGFGRAPVRRYLEWRDVGRWL